MRNDRVYVHCVYIMLHYDTHLQRV